MPVCTKILFFFYVKIFMWHNQMISRMHDQHSGDDLGAHRGHAALSTLSLVKLFKFRAKLSNACISSSCFGIGYFFCLLNKFLGDKRDSAFFISALQRRSKLFGSAAMREPRVLNNNDVSLKLRFEGNLQLLQTPNKAMSAPLETACARPPGRDKQILGLYLQYSTV
jgi:hypothetical protein